MNESISNIQAPVAEAQELPGKFPKLPRHWGEIPTVREMRRQVESLRKAEYEPRLKRRRWDSLDITQLLEAALDGFSNEFYRCPWDAMTDKDAARVLSALADQVADLVEAQCSPSVAIQPGKDACRNAVATPSDSGGVRVSREGVR